MSRPAFVYHSDYEIDIGPHVFPTTKFRMVKERLVSQGIVSEEEIEESLMPSDEDLLRVLEPEYLADMRSGVHSARTIRSELPLSEEIIRGCIRCAGGSILCAQRAFEEGAACHLGGGFHHGFAGHAEGFCYVNDVAIAVATAIGKGWCGRAAVIDTDVHQGNGTARIFQGEERVFTFSIHQEDLYPIKQKSDLDIGLPIFVGDEGYAKALEPAIHRIVEDFRPQLAFVVAGVDPYEEDQLGSLGLTFEGMKRRETVTLKPLVDAGIPFVTVTGGGYARNLADTVALHVQTITTAIDLLAEKP